MKGTKNHFKTFPEFSELKLSDRDAYNKLIAKYPPISEISFSTLMTWWSALDNCKISLLNDNVVISYWLPGDEKNSGLSLVGTNKIDESICEIFDHLKAKGQECKLVHVPEFTLANINYPDMYRCKQEPNYAESIIPIKPYASLENNSLFMKAKVGSFLRATKKERVDLISVDLNDPDNKDSVIDHYFEWKNKKHILVANKLPSYAESAFLDTINHSDYLNLEVLSIFVDDDMHSFTVLETSKDKNYKIVKYSGFSCEIPGLYEYSRYLLAKKFSEEKAEYVNMVIHIGDPK